MKRLSILLNMQHLQISSVSSHTFDYIYLYTNYKLSPYKRLGLFAYNTFPENNYCISGAVDPLLLTTHIVREATIITQKKQEIFPHIELSNFFFTETNNFYLMDDEFQRITHSPENYCIIFSHLYN